MPNGVNGYDVTNTGAVMPGGAEPGAGTFTINGNNVQDANASLDIELGGTVGGTDYDVLTVTGAATFAGVLNVRFIEGFEPRTGDKFTIVNYAAREGAFWSIIDPEGFTFEAEYGDTGLTLTATALQPTGGTGLCGSIGMIPPFLMGIPLGGCRMIGRSTTSPWSCH